MSRASQSERQLGDGLLRKELVDAQSDLVAAEAGEFREQGSGIDLDDEPPSAAADDLAVRAQAWLEDLVERPVVRAAALAATCLPQDIAQKITGLLRFGHGGRLRPGSPCLTRH